MTKYKLVFINSINGHKTVVNTSASCKGEAILKVKKFFLGLLLDRVEEF